MKNFRSFGILIHKAITMLHAGAIKKYGLIVVSVVLMTGHLCAQKLIDSIVTYHYPSEWDSVYGNKITNEYNGAGQITSHSIYLWDTISNQWNGVTFFSQECFGCTGRYEYHYDEKGNQILAFLYGWKGLEPGWVLRGKIENNYDDFGNNVSITYNGWDALKKEWIPSFGYEYTYDEARRMTSKSTYDYQYPDSLTWHPLEHMLYTFDSLGRKSEEISQLWSETARDWINQKKTEWYYDPPLITVGNTDFRWAPAGKNFEWQEEARYKTVDEFDQSGNRVLTTQSKKSSYTAWTPIWKEELAYNPLGQTVLSVISEGTSTLIERLRTEQVYDPTGRRILETQTGRLQRWPLPYFNYMGKFRVIRSFDADGDLLREIWYRWNDYTEAYIFDRKDYYFYHSTSTGHQETVIDPIRINPNPTSGILNLSGLSKPAEVKIYSMQGILLRSVQNVDLSVNISDLASGAYLIQVVVSGQPIFRTVLIKE